MNPSITPPATDDAQDAPTSPRSPLAAFPPLPLPEVAGGRPQEFYGFVAWMATSLAWILFLLWGFLPDAWIQATGITWYPNREWALLLPAYSIVIIILTYFTYWALAISNTPSFSELRTITDSYAHIPTGGIEDEASPYAALLSPEAIPEIYDIPIGVVNRLAYGKRRRPIDLPRT
ncbi:hypothetical protein FRB96_002342 [Tulasnella sp. 330]|nr:hypothetical protein FRB96_002342 [Tulasnella sp. 330]KAG8876180.1 hypothetical protein FRB98_007399 [Tulasnella sp. 332]KAG8876577.1 hypothetical protein FRB97_004087 [Tulasnella sp. 331]